MAVHDHADEQLLAIQPVSTDEPVAVDEAPAAGDGHVAALVTAPARPVTAVVTPPDLDRRLDELAAAQRMLAERLAELAARPAPTPATPDGLAAEIVAELARAGALGRSAEPVSTDPDAAAKLDQLAVAQAALAEQVNELAARQREIHAAITAQFDELARRPVGEPIDLAGVGPIGFDGAATEQLLNHMAQLSRNVTELRQQREDRDHLVTIANAVLDLRAGPDIAQAVQDLVERFDRLDADRKLANDA